MGFTDSIQKIRQSFSIKKGVSVKGTALSVPNPESDISTNPEVFKRPTSPQWFYAPVWGQPRTDFNPYDVRRLGRSVWSQMVTGTIKKELLNIEWEFVPIDEDEEPKKYEAQIKLAEDFFANVNVNRENFFQIMNPVISDIAEIDAGAIVKVFSKDSYEIDDRGRVVLKEFGKRKLKELWYGDGATFLFDVDLKRVINGFYQYSFRNLHGAPIYYSRDEVSYLKMNGRSYDHYGFSPLQSALQIVQIMMNSDRWNKDFYQNNAIPSAIVGVKDARDQDEVDGVADGWNDKVKGSPHKVVFMNSALDFKQMNISNRDMEWMEGQRWYKNAIFGVFGVSPVEAGFHEDVSHNSQAGQERVTVKNAIKPYIKKIEDHVYHDILRELFQDERPPIKMKAFPKDHAQENIEFEHDMKEIEVGSLTINERRKKLGRDEVDWGEVPSNIPNPEDDVSSKDDPNGKDIEKPEDEPDKNDKSAKVKKKSLETPGEDIKELSEPYDQFLAKLYLEWGDKVVRALKDVPLGKSNRTSFLKQQKFIQKNLSDFLSGLFKEVDQEDFNKKVGLYVASRLSEGVKEASTELGVNIGLAPYFGEQVRSLTDQQFNGYTIDGKLWPGIKGVNAKIRDDVFDKIREGVVDFKTRKEIINDVKDVFKSASDVTAERIARTETNRFFNTGKLTGYATSGVRGKKRWNSLHDNRTSKVCDYLSKKYAKGIPFDQPFITKEGKELMNPPAHPNCRSAVGFVFTGGKK